jgi:hypothetical protein
MAELKIEFICDEPTEGEVIKTSTTNIPDGYEYESSGRWESPFQVHIRKDYPDRADIKKITIKDAPTELYHRWWIFIDGNEVSSPPGAYR